MSLQSHAHSPLLPIRKGPEPIRARDYCSARGAQALADKIKAYWQARGLSVWIIVRPADLRRHIDTSTLRYDVRSDMINGLPRGEA